MLAPCFVWEMLASRSEAVRPLLPQLPVATVALLPAWANHGRPGDQACQSPPSPASASTATAWRPIGAINVHGGRIWVPGPARRARPLHHVRTTRTSCCSRPCGHDDQAPRPRAHRRREADLSLLIPPVHGATASGTASRRARGRRRKKGSKTSKERP